MNRANRDTWQCARSLNDLGELTAQWMQGMLAEQPGYYGPSDLDDPDRLVPVLAAVNRAGYVTIQSQHAFYGPGYDEAHWQQRAAVMGFASAPVADLLTRTASLHGLAVFAHDPRTLPRWRTRHGTAVAVTRREGGTYTSFGSQFSRSFLRGQYGDCHPLAVAALCSAWQVTVVDPVWGRRDLLWDVLAGMCERSRRK